MGTLLNVQVLDGVIRQQRLEEIGPLTRGDFKPGLGVMSSIVAWIWKASYTLGPLDQKFSWEQLSELEAYFKMEPYPDLQARKIMATRLKLKEEQVEAWFIQRSLEEEMRPPLARLQQSARDDTSSPSHKALCCRPPSWKYRLIPINPPESSTSCKHSC
ncbi:homeobox protein ceh-8-like [Mus caroli]|uniref:Homeobox protein ceh-8-like n=1 Tax=Mus caroli TaxID=10089 RepID=A0A6P5PTE8_MUSCR|nr:homeobox protein ceh-8-like [Mus caroli]